MPTVTAGTSASVTLSGAQTIALSLDPSEEAQVIVTRSGIQFYGSSVRSSKTIGPYLNGDVLTITASRGAVEYTLASYTDPAIDALESAAIQALVSGSRIADATSRSINADDNAMFLAPSGALTYTIPAGLSPMPSFTVDCPASGTISIARSGAATINGAGITLTRARVGNPVGFVVLAHTETDSYGVSGS